MIIEEGRQYAHHFLKTVSYLSDGRVLKWVNYLQRSGIYSVVSIVEDKNKKSVYQEDNVIVDHNELWFRKFFKKRRGYLFKVFEYLIQTIKQIKKYDKSDFLIFHDVQQYANLFIVIFLGLKGKRRIIWDLHELPHVSLEHFWITRKFIEYILNRVDLIVYTNQERRNYILEKYNVQDQGRFFILNNFPDHHYNQALKNDLPNAVASWLKGRNYILWMGAANDARNFKIFLETFKDFKDRACLVLIGKVLPNFKNEIQELISEGVAYNDFVPQSEIIRYVDNAFFSVVLYKDTSPNNYLCEPNRLYQLVNRNIPCIVGHNPTLKYVIQQTSGGFVLEDDGSSHENMNYAFHEMFEDRNKYSENLRSIAIEKRFCWDNQFELLIHTLRNLQ